MISLYKPFMPELPDLNRILHSGSLAYGEYTREFEKKLKLFLDTDSQVLATNSFNMAIAVATSVLNIKSGDEVIASPMACLASTQPFATQGIRVIWADVDPRTGTLCPESVRKKISKQTKAIVHNHFCGYPGFIDEINVIGKEYGISVIDDCIEAFGSEYKGRKLGNCGTDITIFSFNAVRIPNTIDGGAIIIHNKDLLKQAVLIRDCGIDRSIFRDELGEISPLCDITVTGHSATMSNVNAYIGICQMENMHEILKRQRRQALWWDRELENNAAIERIVRKEIHPNYWVYGTLVSEKRETIRKYRKLGWYASGVHINNNIYSIFGRQDNLPGVDEFYSHFVALPCGWWVQEEVGQCKEVY